MVNNYLPNKHVLLFVITLVLIATNLMVIKFYEIETSRMIRLLSTFLYFIFFIIYKKYWISFVFLSLILFIIRDLFIINYEIPTYKTATFVFTIFAYFSLIYHSVKKLNFSRFSPVILIFVVLLFSVNLFNLYYLAEVLKNGIDNQIQLLLFYIQGGVLLILGFTAYLYYDKYYGKTPLHYLFFVICFVFCDLSGLAAYFYHINSAFYFERFFYIMGLFLLVNFMFTATIPENEKGYL